MLDADFVIAAPPTPFPKPGFGWACASYDATGDGRTDLLVSDPTAVEYRGAVYLFSGDDIAP